MTVSYFEWVQNRNGYHWTENEIHDRLLDMMRSEACAVFDLVYERGIDMRTAAYVHAFERLGDAVSAKGTHEYFAEQ